MTTSLVTGGAGFIGSHLVECLLSQGDRVVVMDDLSTGSERNLARLQVRPNWSFVKGSVLDTGAVRSMVEAADRVFHLAAAVGVERVIRLPVESIHTNVIGASNVLSCCAEFRKPVLLTSSSEVYGKSPQIPFREDSDLMLGSTTKLRWLYACSKAMGEFEAHAYHCRQGLPAVVVRLFNTTGPRQTGRYGMVIPRLVRQALDGKPITVYGDGSQSRCFAHVGDVAPAMVKLMATPGAVGRVVNLGSQELVTIRALAERIKAVTGSESPVVYIPFEQAYESGFEDMAIRQPDLGVARELIGYEPKRTLDDIIRDVIADARQAGAAP